MFSSTQCQTDHKLLVLHAPVVKRRSFLSKRRGFNIVPLLMAVLCVGLLIMLCTWLTVHGVSAVDGLAVVKLAQWTIIKESLLQAGSEMFGWINRRHLD